MTKEKFKTIIGVLDKALQPGVQIDRAGWSMVQNAMVELANFGAELFPENGEAKEVVDKALENAGVDANGKTSGKKSPAKKSSAKTSTCDCAGQFTVRCKQPSRES